jgi:uncharacterized membrane protein
VDDLYVIVLRIAHIGAGVFWVGAAFITFGFLNPGLKALGPATTKSVMGQLVGRQRFPLYVMVASLMTVVAGFLLYWRASGGLDMNWVLSPMGLGFGLGGVAGTIALVMGATMITPTVKRMEALGAEIESAGAPPTAEQGAEMAALDRRLDRVGLADFALLSVALLLMAISRYLPAA